MLVATTCWCGPYQGVEDVLRCIPYLSPYGAASYIIKMREIYVSCKLCGGITLPTAMIINTIISSVVKSLVWCTL